MKYPHLHNRSDLNSDWDVAALIGDKWHPARPLGYPSLRNRFRLAWGVFTGRYDALKWGGGQ